MKKLEYVKYATILLKLDAKTNYGLEVNDS